MENINFTPDFSILTEEAQKEMIQFYEFLLYKYGKKENLTPQKKFHKYLQSPIKLDQAYRFNRNELYE